MGGRDHRFQPRAAVLVAVLVGLAGCTDFGDPIRPPAPRPAAVTITSPSGASADLAVGAKLQFTAVVQDDRGGTLPDAEIRWESSAPAVATIDSAGVARGLTLGSTAITAVNGTLRSRDVQVNVQVGTVALVLILSQATRTIAVGGTLALQAEARDAADNLIPNARFTWTVDHPTLASIDSLGQLRGLALGQTFVRAASGGVQSAPVTVQIVYDGPDYVTQVQPIFDANCVSCHGRSGGLNLAAAVSYANLVNVRANGSPLQRVLPGDPGNSYLYVKIAGPCPGPVCSGGRMPAGLPPLPAADIQVIHDWIAGGAPR